MRLLHASFALSASALAIAIGCSTPDRGTGSVGAGGTAATGPTTTGPSTGTMSTTSSTGTGGGMECNPGEKSCLNSGEAQTCRPDGKGYDVMPCPPGGMCMNGVCTCGAVGTTQCNGMTVVKCGMDGMFHDDFTCPMGTTCREGLCDDLRCADEIQAGGSTALPTKGWPRYRHDNRSSGWTHAVMADQPKLKWKIFVGGTQQLNSPYGGMADGPVVNQTDIIFVGAGDGDNKGGHFYSFDKNGKQVYEFAGPTGYGYTTPAVRADGTAYYSTADGHAYAVNPNGTQLWQYSFGFQNDCSPIVTKDGFVIYGSDTSQLFALQSNGMLLWQSDPAAGPGEVDSALAESCDGLIYAGGANGWTTLDAKTGMTVWQVPATGSYHALMSSPTVQQDGTMYGIDSGGMGYAIDKTGKTLWSKSVGPAGAATDFAHVGDKLFAVLNDGNLHAFDVTNGSPLWQQPVGHSPEIFRHAGPVVDGHMRLYFGSNDGNVYCFDTTGKLLWKLPSSGMATPNGNSFGTPAIGEDGTLYVPGNDGNLYAYQ